jgi:hypothetical protein
MAPTVQFTTASGSAPEGKSGTSTDKVQATLSAASTQAVTVPISYAGTATSGTDYTNASTSITIAAGQTTASATLSAVGDSRSCIAMNTPCSQVGGVLPDDVFLSRRLQGKECERRALLSTRSECQSRRK